MNSFADTNNLGCVEVSHTAMTHRLLAHGCVALCSSPSASSSSSSSSPCAGRPSRARELRADGGGCSSAKPSASSPAPSPSCPMDASDRRLSSSANRATASRLEGASPRQLCSIPTLRSGQEERQVRRLISAMIFSLKSTCRSARGQTTCSSQPVGAASRYRPGDLRAVAARTCQRDVILLIHEGLLKLLGHLVDATERPDLQPQPLISRRRHCREEEKKCGLGRCPAR